MTMNKSNEKKIQEDDNKIINNLFCRNCNNLLFLDISSDELKYVCKACNTIYQARDEDTLIYEEVKQENIDKYAVMLKKVTEDPLNPRIKIKCNKCNHNYGIKIRITTEMRLYIICEKCKNKIDNF